MKKIEENGNGKNCQVILNLIQDLRRLLLSFRNGVRGRFQIKFGMSALFNKDGFTLIELLVVVLIIGILAAIAVPQYQKAVEKSRASEAITLLKSVADAAKMYYLTSGQWPNSFNQLDITIPWTGKEKWRNSSEIKDSLSNGTWSLQIFRSTASESIYIGRLLGPYRGIGFILPMHLYKESYLTLNKVMCVEKMSSSIKYKGKTGSYCQTLFHGKMAHSSESLYSLP